MLYGQMIEPGIDAEALKLAVMLKHSTVTKTCEVQKRSFARAICQADVPMHSLVQTGQLLPT